MYLYLFIVSALLVHNVCGLIDKELNYTFYETNFLKSDIKRYKIKSCMDNTDCPNFAYCKKQEKYNYCDYKFYCRTDYACFLAIPKETEIRQIIVGRLGNVNGTIGTIGHEFSVNTSNKFEKQFILGEETKLKLGTSLKDSGYCSSSCTDHSDCYSESCEGNCCVINSKIKEFVCGPREYEVEKAQNITDLENKKIECKSDVNQNCSKHDDCFTNLCDYSGICVESYIPSEEKKYKNEVNIFYVFIVIIILLISSVLLCSIYFGRRVSKPGKGKRKHLLED